MTVTAFDVAREKRGRNARVQARYDELMAEGKRGHYETLFRVVREEVEAERERCAKIAENYSNAKPGDISEVMAGDWQHGIAAAIRGA